MLFSSNALRHTHALPQRSHLGTAQRNHSLLLLATEQLGVGCLAQGALPMVGRREARALFIYYPRPEGKR